MAKQTKQFDKYPYDVGFSGEPIYHLQEVISPRGVLEIEIEDFVELCDLVTLFENFIRSGTEKIGSFKAGGQND